MVTKKIKELEATKAKLVQLEKTVAVELRRELGALHGAYGFANVAAFVQAVKAAAKGGRKARRPAKSAKAPAGKAKRRRAVITDATRASVKKLAQAGKTGAEIAKALKISLPSVQYIKKALGLVKARK